MTRRSSILSKSLVQTPFAIRSCRGFEVSDAGMFWACPTTESATDRTPSTNARIVPSQASPREAILLVFARGFNPGTLELAPARSLRLVLVLAEVGDHALRAVRLARRADVAPVQDQPVVRVVPEFLRREFDQLALHLFDIGARREPGAVRHAEDVRVDRDRRLAEGDVEHDVRGLAPDPGQLHQRFHGGGH